MGHNVAECAMGSIGSSAREIDEVSGDPATYPAGTAVRMNSSGGPTVVKASGSLMGVSLGRSLSDTSKLAICRTGLRVPILVEAAPARGVVVITSYANLVLAGDDTLKVGATTFTFKASASLESEVTAASANGTTATNLANKINAHSVAGLLFKATVLSATVTITALDNATLGEDIDLVYTDAGTATVGLTTDDTVFTGGGSSTDFVTIGQKVYISDTTGKADDANSGSTISKAIYVSGAITGYDESGAAVTAALIDMPRGL